MRPLVLCQSCKRHVKRSETTCPFCSAIAGAALLGVAAPVEPGLRTATARGRPGGRAALFLAGAALASGCEGTATPVYGVAIDPEDRDEMGTPVYGVAVDAGRFDAGRDAGHPLATPAYGISIDPGRRDASIATPADAGPPCAQVGNLPVPVYGVGIDVPPRDLCRDAGAGGGLDAGKDAGPDAGKDAGFLPTPPYGISIPTDR